MDELLVSTQLLTLVAAPTNPSTARLQADLLQNVIWGQQRGAKGANAMHEWTSAVAT